MKRYVKMIAAVLALSLTACGGGTQTAEKPAETQAETPAETAAAKTEEASPKQEKKKDKTAEDTPFLDEQVIWDQNDLKITASYEYSKRGPGISLSFDNSTGKDLRVMMRDFIINNYCVSLLVSTKVPDDNSGEPYSLTRVVLNEDLKNYGLELTNAEQMSISFRVFDQGTNELLFDIPECEIKTNPVDPIGLVKFDEGTEVYNADGLRIVAKYADDNDDRRIIVFAENTGSEARAIAVSKVSVNGSDLEALSGAKVLPGKMVVFTEYLNEGLLANKIDSVDEIQVSCAIYDELTAQPIAFTDPVQLPVK
ncbi:MAG: hypothetical protein IJ120_06555 [Solobacterium sp.]|nr:hypothetical protein [Solobacterium sp.]